MSIQQALDDLRKVADELGSRGLIDLADEIRIACIVIECGGDAEEEEAE